MNETDIEKQKGLRHRSTAHRRAWMARIGFLNDIRSQDADGVDALFIACFGPLRVCC